MTANISMVDNSASLQMTTKISLSNPATVTDGFDGLTKVKSGAYQMPKRNRRRRDS